MILMGRCVVECDDESIAEKAPQTACSHTCPISLNPLSLLQPFGHGILRSANVIQPPFPNTSLLLTALSLHDAYIRPMRLFREVASLSPSPHDAAVALPSQLRISTPSFPAIRMKKVYPGSETAIFRQLSSGVNMLRANVPILKAGQTSGDISVSTLTAQAFVANKMLFEVTMIRQRITCTTCCA